MVKVTGASKLCVSGRGSCVQDFLSFEFSRRTHPNAGSDRRTVGRLRVPAHLVLDTLGANPSEVAAADARHEPRGPPCCVFRSTWARVPAALDHAFRSPGRRSERSDEYRPVGAKRRMDDQLFSVCSVVPSFFSFIPFLLRIDGPFSDRT